MSKNAFFVGFRSIIFIILIGFLLLWPVGGQSFAVADELVDKAPTAEQITGSDAIVAPVDSEKPEPQSAITAKQVAIGGSCIADYNGNVKTGTWKLYGSNQNKLRCFSPRKNKTPTFSRIFSTCQIAIKIGPGNVEKYNNAGVATDKICRL